MGTSTETASLPVYAVGEVPEHLRTKTQLKGERLKLAPDQEPAARVWMNLSGAGWQYVDLYDKQNAVPMKPLSAAQQAAYDARRTCSACGELREYIVYGQCQECVMSAEAARRDLYARTCRWCKRVSGAPLGKDSRGCWACVPCRIRDVLRGRAERERRALWERSCAAGCGTILMSGEEVVAAKRKQLSAGGSAWFVPAACGPCQERLDAEEAERRLRKAEAERREREYREKELPAWAREVLADPATVILDTETTGRESDARIVEISVMTAGGEVLLDTLVNPGVSIPEEVTSIHGITDEDVAGAPSFEEILVQLTAVLDRRRCLIYNAPFDMARLRYELLLHYRRAGHAEPEQSAAAWMGLMRFEDVMVPYSDWFGDWSDYWGNYAWQPLNGGHRALGDCRAVVNCLKSMARPLEGSQAVEEADGAGVASVGMPA